MSLFKEHGPCKVNADSNSTRHNQWSWNAESDILYIDQPVQTGFSYDRLEPGVLDAFGNVFLNRNQEKSKRPFLKQGSRQGIFSSNDPQQTANSTESIVRSTWFYLQAWLQNFHGRQQSPNSTINFWTSSYGGHFAPRLVKYALEQNVRLKAGELDSNKYMRMQIGSLGITNSCADGPTQLPYYPEMARNNSYNIPLINQEDYHTAIQHLSKPGGCISKIEDCRAAAPSPSLDLGQNETVNAICHDANTYCGKHVAGLLSSSGTSFFDIAYRNDFLNDPLSETYFGYLNQRHIQDTLGVQLNFSGNSPVVAHAFSSTGDNVKAGYLEALGSILDSGVNVALIYGDRDFACNCKFPTSHIFEFYLI
jgi:carboxypeptidase D